MGKPEKQLFILEKKANCSSITSHRLESKIIIKYKKSFRGCGSFEHYILFNVTRTYVLDVGVLSGDEQG